MPDTQSHHCNVLLRSLHRRDYVALVEHFEAVDLAPGQLLCEAGDRIDTIYFPKTAIISLSERTPQGDAEIALIGCDGAIGWPIMLGSDVALHRAVVRLDGGAAIACRTTPVMRLCAQSETFAASLLRYAQSIVRQLSLSIVANLAAPIEARLARWLLMLHDRSAGDTLGITHLELASFLGVRRASVTDTLHVLEGEYIVRCTRGRIDILDREALHLRAAGTYGTAESVYRSLVGPFGKSLTPPRTIPAASGLFIGA